MKNFSNCKNSNSLWSEIFIETLKNLGLKTAVISPGSRSTPLTAAFSHSKKIEVVPVLDERSAAFFALGLAKSTQRPVALLCTSGTAVANYLPAVVEAKMSRTPLVVISADRPPEMQNCHAGQTILQPGIFSSFPIFEKNVVPEASQKSFEEAAKIAAEAFENAVKFSAPAHVNVGFRDPLSPHLAEENFAPEKFKIPSFPRKLGAGTQISSGIPENAEFAKNEILKFLNEGKRGIFVAGTTPPGQDDTFNVAFLAKKFSAPILSDATHPLRQFSPTKFFAIERFDKIFRRAENQKNIELVPDFVVQIGTLPESKFLRNWLSKIDVPVFLFNFCGDDTDALKRKKIVNSGVRISEIFPEIFEHGNDAETSFEAAAGTTNSNSRERFLEVWKAADFRERRVSDEFFRERFAKNFSAGTPSEPEVARFLCENVPEPETMIFVSNGMPVRDFNAFCPAGKRFWCFHNRGANGIDGTLSAALGVAHGCLEQTILYVGDLSLLHDTNGFLISPHFKGNLTIVLVNNFGGNIFRNLPISESNEADFERLWITPQRVNFEKLAAAYGVDFCFAKTLRELGNALENYRSRAGIHLILIETDGAFSKKIRGEI